MPLFDLPLDELRKYQAPLDEPADFDAFWRETLDAAAKKPLDVSFDRIDDEIYSLVDAFDVTFSGYGGDPVKGWFIEPATNTERRPCVISFLGYGSGRSFPTDYLAPVAAGFAHFVMDTRGQGTGDGPGATGDPHGSGPQAPGFMTHGIESPNTYYYRRVFVDAVRAVETAARRPGVDPDRLAVCGVSQGGGIAIAAAALAPKRVRLLAADLPFLTHYRRGAEMAVGSPYNEITAYLKSHRDRVETAFRTLSYFDGVNFAPRIRARCLFSVALMDTVCPPSTVFAAYNRIPAEKEMRVYEFNEHEGGASHQAVEQLRFLTRHL